MISPLCCAHPPGTIPPALKSPALAKPESGVLVAEMRDVILGLAHAGQPTTEEDLKRRGFSVSEIAELGPRAAHEAAEALRDIETAGIRRVRVPAATCAGTA